MRQLVEHDYRLQWLGTPLQSLWRIYVRSVCDGCGMARWQIFEDFTNEKEARRRFESLLVWEEVDEGAEGGDA